jgi:hypothetical protein
MTESVDVAFLIPFTARSISWCPAKSVAIGPSWAFVTTLTTDERRLKKGGAAARSSEDGSKGWQLFAFLEHFPQYEFMPMPEE